MAHILLDVPDGVLAVVYVIINIFACQFLIVNDIIAKYYIAMDSSIGDIVTLIKN